jgi:hypothetical protein
MVFYDRYETICDVKYIIYFVMHNLNNNNNYSVK